MKPKNTLFRSLMLLACLALLGALGVGVAHAVPHAIEALGAGTLLIPMLLGSLHAIPDIEDDDLDMAVSAAVGAETRVFLSYDDIKNVADLEQIAAGTGDANTAAGLVYDNATLKPDRTFRAPAVGTNGYDLQLICASPVRSSEAIVVVANVLFNNKASTIVSNSIAAASVVTTSAAHGLTTGDTVTIAGVATSSPTINGSRVVTVLTPTTFSVPVNVATAGTGGTATSTIRSGTATATLQPPDRVTDQSFNFPQGLAVDFAPSVAGATIRSLTSIETITGGSAGAKFSIAALPEAGSYIEVACATDKNFEPPSPKSVSIACRYNPSRWVKKGRGKEQKLDLTAKFSSFGDGLPRATGQRVTVKLEDYRDDAILVQRVVFGGWRPEVSLNVGDGDAESTAKATGMYEQMAAFV